MHQQPFSSTVSHPQRSLISQDHKCPPRQVGERWDSLSAAIDARKGGGNHINELRAWVSQTRLRLWRTSALPRLETAEMLQDRGNWRIKMYEIQNSARWDGGGVTAFHFKIWKKNLRNGDKSVGLSSKLKKNVLCITVADCYWKCLELKLPEPLTIIKVPLVY